MSTTNIESSMTYLAREFLTKVETAVAERRICDEWLVDGLVKVGVKWDNGRSLSLCVPPDVAVKVSQ